MSRDIRSFFTIQKDKKKKDEDSDVIPESPDVLVVKKKKPSRKRRQIEEDSDEEIFSKSKKKQSPQKPALKEVKAVDMFGSTKIKRTEPIVKKTKKETETGIHSDDEFEKSLLQIDEIINNESPPKENHVEKFNEKLNNDKEETIKDKPKDHGSTSNNEIKENNHDSKNNISSKKRKLDNSVNESEKEQKNESKDLKLSRNTKSEQKNKSKLKDKTDFSEFLENEDNHGDQEQSQEPKSKKQKLDKSLNESVLTDEERHERKRYSAALYQKYLNRSGPKHHGAKEMPEGAPNCLKECAFLITGVLDSFEREEVEAAINKYGGCIKSGVSKKVTHVIAGDDAGPAKLAKAQELGIKIINEDEFLQMISKSSDNKTPPKEIKKEKNSEKGSEKRSDKKSNHKKHESNTEKKISPKNKSNETNGNSQLDVVKIKKEKSVSPQKGTGKERDKSKDKSSKEKDNTSHKKDNSEAKTSREKDKYEAKLSQVNVKKEAKTDQEKDKSKTKINLETNKLIKSEPLSNGELKKSNSIEIPKSLMWVDKYKPQNIKQIIGQHGDASNVKKLTNWLTKWYANRKAKLPKPSPWAKNDDGGYFKAALLSGPPGVGKTTTVSLVCKELGFDAVEFNASDTRSKTLIREQIGELLTTNSLAGYAKGATGKGAISKKHVLVMDEVDGMAGNEDRGGLQELIALIKSTSVPVICMCNDRNSEKMRTLVNYCYDLRFSRPRVDQIKAAMMSICYKEGVKIPPDVLSQLIVAAGQDVRQTLHLLSVWAADTDRMEPERLRNDAGKVRKDVKMGPWEAIRKVFSAEEHKTMSINDKSDLFFSDYSLIPLFVQENYLSVSPHCPKHEVLERLSKAAESISMGDLVEARIRGSQAWNLLPVQAMCSCVSPGVSMAGHVAGQIQFPGWLGRQSRSNKMQRLCREIHAHTRLSTSGSKSSIFLDYSSHLRDAIVNPLIKDRADGVEQSLAVLESYNLMREDLDSLVELSVWPGQRNPTVLIDAKVKAAMTRAYNKKASALPYAPVAVKKGRGQDDNETEYDEEDNADDSDPENDGLIKKKKTKDSEKAGPSKSTDKGKGESSKAGKGKGKKKK